MEIRGISGSVSTDCCVVGGTPAVIAAAVRAASEVHTVLLAQHTRHLGGMCTNGLGQWDAQSGHRRCPIFAEILDKIQTHCREIYGHGSPAHVAATYDHRTYHLSSYEPSVIEQIVTDLVAGEPRGCWSESQKLS